jgi:hypothetical protein
MRSLPVVPAMNAVRIAALTLWTVTVACAGAVHTRDVPLAPGPFEGLESARLGAGAIFENDIDSSTCFPLELNGRTEVWLASAYIRPNRVLVRRCELDGDGAALRENHRGGWRRPVWDLMLVEPAGTLRFVPLELPRWTFMANPAFCDESVAYWGLDTLDDGIHSMLRPTVFDLATRAVIQVGTIGPAELRTDFEGFLSPPVWDTTCGSVEFDGQPVGEGRSTLSVTRNR